MTVFPGRPRVFWLAVCLQCEALLPMPFGTEADRDAWAGEHRSTGHTVKEFVEVRPESGS